VENGKKCTKHNYGKGTVKPVFCCAFFCTKNFFIKKSLDFLKIIYNIISINGKRENQKTFNDKTNQYVSNKDSSNSEREKGWLLFS